MPDQTHKTKYQKLRDMGLCGRCGKNLAREGKTECFDCSERGREYQRAVRARRKTAGVCKSCGVAQPECGTLCVPCHDKVQQKLQELRSGVFAAYGDYCNCCGESNRAFLVIDHVNDDGAKHRREIGSTGGTSMYRWLRKNNYPPGFQTLCANCNMAKQTQGICPHQKGRAED